MKILLLGANGFLGQACQKFFKSKNLDYLTSDLHGEVDFKGSLSEIEFVQTLPQTDVVINCAAVQYVSKNLPFFGRKNFFYINNVISSKNLLDFYKNKQVHFINIGTSMMYSSSNNVHDPDLAIFGNNGLYSYSKIESHNILKNIKNYTLIIPPIIGGQGRAGFFEKLIKFIFNYNFVFLPGKCQKKTSIVDVTDVTRLIFQIVIEKQKGIFNVASDDSLTIYDWTKIISEKLQKKKLKIICIPFFLVNLLSILSCYRLLAQEQLLMLKNDHIVLNSKSKLIGWKPLKDSKKIILSTLNEFIRNNK